MCCFSFGACCTHPYCTQPSKEQRDFITETVTKSASWVTQADHCPTVSVSLLPSCYFSPSCNIFCIVNPQVAVRLSGQSASNSSVIKRQEATKYASVIQIQAIVIGLVAMLIVYKRDDAISVKNTGRWNMQ